MIDTVKEKMNTFAVPLTLEARQLAESLAKQQPTRYKFKQVYLNTLAVYAGKFFLQCWGFETEWEDCDSFNPVKQMLMDVADLEVKKLGRRLEFRPVLPDADVLHIPYDVWDDRMGYVAVQLDPSLRQATLLGFTKNALKEEVPLSELHSLEALLDELRIGKQPLHLSTWLYNGLKQGKKLVEQGWQSFEELWETLSPQEPARAYRFGAATAFRGSATAISDTTRIPTLIDLLHKDSNKLARLRAIELLGDVGKGNQEAIGALTELLKTADDNDYETRREVAVTLGKIDPMHPQAGLKMSKTIDLGMELDGCEVALIITLAPKSHEEMQIHLRVFPMRTKTLPINLCLTFLDEQGNIVQETRSRSNDDWIQLDPFMVDIDTACAVQLTLNEAKFVQKIVV